jgi:hypothetical protein
VLLWLGLVAANELIKPPGASAAPLCNFRRITGVPCPTCGSTRAVLAAGGGHVLEAFTLNPLLMAAVTAASIWLLLRLILGAKVKLPLNQRQRRIAWIVAAIALLANWVYVIAHEMS